MAPLSFFVFRFCVLVLVIGLAGLMCCENYLVTLIVIMMLTATFQVLFTVSLFCAWNLTTVEFDSGVTEKLNPPRAFTSGGFGLDLVILVLVLVSRIWSCLHDHWCLGLDQP